MPRFTSCAWVSGHFSSFESPCGRLMGSLVDWGGHRMDFCICSFRCIQTALLSWISAGVRGRWVSEEPLHPEHSMCLCIMVWETTVSVEVSALVQFSSVAQSCTTLYHPVPPRIRVFSNESTLHMRWPKYWSFSFSIIPSKEIPGLISQGLLQHHSSKASILQRSAFFTVQLSHPYMTIGKTIALTRWTLVTKQCLCFWICYLCWP